LNEMVHIGISNPLIRGLPEKFVHDLYFFYLFFSVMRFRFTDEVLFKGCLYLKVKDSVPLYKILIYCISNIGH
jgi:hypothetical protein